MQRLHDSGDAGTGPDPLLDPSHPIRRTFVLLGEGSLLPEMVSYARRLRLNVVYAAGDDSGSSDPEEEGDRSRVFFFGLVPPAELACHLARADVLVAPALYPEAFGLAPVEASLMRSVRDSVTRCVCRTPTLLGAFLLTLLARCMRGRTAPAGFLWSALA